MVNLNVEMTNTQMEWIDDKSRELLIEGSAGSGKTIFACYKAIFYALQNDMASVYVYRVTLPSLKRTSWKEIRELLYDLKIPYFENKSEGFIEFGNKSKLYFGALDSLSKVRSINADMIYIEQAEELKDPAFYEELLLRLGRGKASRKPGNYAQMLLVVQPESEEHWIYKKYHLYDDVGAHYNGFGEWVTAEQDLAYKKEHRKTAHFHYSENYYLPPETRANYDNLRNVDYDLWLRYSAGKWGKLSGVIYPNYDTVVLRNSFDFYTGGVDFGFNNPSCFLLCGWYDNECYVLDEVYERELLNRDFIQKTKDMLFEHHLLPESLDMVCCDKANPDDIEEFRQNDFAAEGGIKDVTAKINTVKQTKIHIHPTCVNTIKEIKGYKWKVDKDGVTLDEPVKFNDHAMDALGYAVYGVRGQLSPTRNIPDNNDRFKVMAL